METRFKPCDIVGGLTPQSMRLPFVGTVYYVSSVLLGTVWQFWVVIGILVCCLFVSFVKTPRSYLPPKV
eukprot:3899665-Amphidinium_carterae.1